MAHDFGGWLPTQQAPQQNYARTHSRGSSISWAIACAAQIDPPMAPTATDPSMPVGTTIATGFTYGLQYQEDGVTHKPRTSQDFHNIFAQQGFWGFGSNETQLFETVHTGQNDHLSPVRGNASHSAGTAAAHRQLPANAAHANLANVSGRTAVDDAELSASNAVEEDAAQTVGLRERLISMLTNAFRLPALSNAILSKSSVSTTRMTPHPKVAPSLLLRPRLKNRRLQIRLITDHLSAR